MGQLQPKTQLTYSRIFLLPLVVSIFIVTIIAINYARYLEERIYDQYDRVEESLHETVGLMNALNYNFATFFGADNFKMPFEQSATLTDGVCHIRPEKQFIRSAYQFKTTDFHELKLDYQFVGDHYLCDSTSPAYQSVEQYKILAPTFAFLNDINNHNYGLYFLSKYGYMLASPADRADSFTTDMIGSWNKRQYWQEAEKGQNTIQLIGPATDFVTGAQIMSITTGVFDDSTFEGMVVRDIFVKDLLKDEDPVTENIHIVDDSKLSELTSNMKMVSKLSLPGINSTQLIYFEWDWWHEIKWFLAREQIPLLGVLAFYLMVISALVYMKVHGEKAYFTDLAFRDPMTGLLNRRGFLAHYKRRKSSKYQGVAMFDIDDFKKVNDTFGHNVGDKVIIEVGKILHRQVRSTDIPSRFGGEEFALYLQADEPHQLQSAVERIKQVTALMSHKVIDNGFTVSVGLAIVKGDDTKPLSELIKIADEKLYIAKTTGKNKVVS